MCEDSSPLFTVVNLCNPCGEDCSSHNCENDKCAIGCADSYFNQRRYDPGDYNAKNTDEIYVKYTGTDQFENVYQAISSLMSLLLDGL